ncbi:MAG: hypothetical protein WCE75_17825 [Terracidiphilus sp.]
MPREQQEAIARRGAELAARVTRRMILAETRKDPRLSTMQRTVAAMGGHLTLMTTCPKQEPVILVGSQAAVKTASLAKRA